VVVGVVVASLPDQLLLAAHQMIARMMIAMMM